MSTPPHIIYLVYMYVGLASVGNGAVKHASHCVSLITGVPFFFFFFITSAGGRVRLFLCGENLNSALGA